MCNGMKKMEQKWIGILIRMLQFRLKPQYSTESMIKCRSVWQHEMIIDSRIDLITESHSI